MSYEYKQVYFAGWIFMLTSNEYNIVINYILLAAYLF
jgi:hypothetical protein